jgi:pectate lyase
MRVLRRIYLCGFVIVRTSLDATLPAGPSVPWETPPGWTETRGGTGGKVIRVTSLAAKGPGSLAAALADAEPRVIEFAVGGTIDLAEQALKLTSPFLTIAGETAPSPGITLVNGDLGIATHDVIVRHLRIRPGAGSRARRIGWEVDGLTTGQGAHDVIVDHCSFSWSTDENLSASGPPFQGATPEEWRKNTSHRITFSHCIVAEALNDSTHRKGLHSMGTLVHDNATDIAIIGNLYLSNNDRNPLCKAGVRVAVINNVMHNPGERVIQFGYVPSQWRDRAVQRAKLTLCGNVARLGPSSAPTMVFFEIWPAYGACDFYLEDNLFFDVTGRPLPAGPGFRDKNQLRRDYPHQLSTGSGYEFQLVPFRPPPEMRRVDTPPVWPPRLRARHASETQAWVLAHAGARPWDRDATDRRLIEEARTGSGRIINFESEAGVGSSP